MCLSLDALIKMGDYLVRDWLTSDNWWQTCVFRIVFNRFCSVDRRNLDKDQRKVFYRGVWNALGNEDSIINKFVVKILPTVKKTFADPTEKKIWKISRIKNGDLIK